MGNGKTGLGTRQRAHSSEQDVVDKGARELERMRAVEQALRFARKELGPDVTALRVTILLNAHLHPASSQRELADLAGGISAAALSRNLADLSAWSSRKAPGLGLIELRPDPMNLRVKRIHLTASGRRFIRRFNRLLEVTAGAGEHASR